MTLATQKHNLINKLINSYSGDSIIIDDNDNDVNKFDNNIDIDDGNTGDDNDENINKVYTRAQDTSLT